MGCDEVLKRVRQFIEFGFESEGGRGVSVEILCGRCYVGDVLMC